MGIYLVAFGFSTLMFYLSSKSKRKFGSTIFACFGILILAILAGLRSSSIGTDVNVYGRRFYEEAVISNSFTAYFSNHVNSLLSESGFYLLTYILSRFFHNYHWGLFVYQLIPLTLIYLGMKRCKKIFNTPIWLGMMLYDLMLYNTSLNIMRQCIAVGFVFYGTTFLFEKKYKLFLLFIVLAIMFHTSAIVCIAILPMYIILCQGKHVSQKKQISQCIIFIGLLIILLISGSQIVRYLVERGIIRAFYLQYLLGGMFSQSTTGIPYVIVFGYLLYTFIMIFYKKYTDRRKGESVFFIMSSIIVTIASFFVKYIQYIDRLNLYFIPLQALAISNIYNCNKQKNIYVFIILGIAFSLWFYSFVLKGSGETVPYEFFFR